MNEKMKYIKSSILVIDDDPGVSKLLDFILTKAGFDVSRVYDGHHAIEFLAQSVPDLILCDILMPEMSGLDVLTFIRNAKHLRNIPVVAVTALNMTGYKEKFLEHGFNAYFAKPINVISFPKQIMPYLKMQQREADNNRQSAGEYSAEKAADKGAAANNNMQAAEKVSPAMVR